MTRLIDADAIKYTMLYKENWLKGTGVEKQGVWKEDIDAMPTVDAVPVRHGRWISRPAPSNSYCGYLICSNCGEEVSDADEYNYCPNCGARMNEE